MIVLMFLGLFLVVLLLLVVSLVLSGTFGMRQCVRHPESPASTATTWKCRGRCRPRFKHTDACVRAATMSVLMLACVRAQKCTQAVDRYLSQDAYGSIYTQTDVRVRIHECMSQPECIRALT